jgi:hypothetical protein
MQQLSSKAVQPVQEAVATAAIATVQPVQAAVATAAVTTVQPVQAAVATAAVTTAVSTVSSRSSSSCSYGTKQELDQH